MSKRLLNTDNFDVIGGRNLVQEALKAGNDVKRIYIENAIKESKNYGNDARIHDIISIARSRNIPVEYISRDDIRLLEKDEGVRTEGVAAFLPQRVELTVSDIFALCKQKNKEPFIILVNNILYEENLGAILRTCAAGGVDALIIPKRDNRSLTPNVRRISMGGSEYVPLVRSNLFEALDEIHDEGIQIIGVELNGSAYYYDANLSGPIAIILGGEDAGLTAPLQKRCDQVVKIPMIGMIQSLNVSVSTAILIYEKIRQECQN